MALTAKKVYAILKRQISDMEAKLNSPVRYRGTVATADLLPLNPDIGDMYNIESKSVYGEAGMNVAWNGVVWDTMGAPIDMSLYFTKEEAEAVIQRLVAEYFEKNPVKPGATTEQAQQIEQNKTDIASLKTETNSLKEDISNKITKFYASNQGETHITDSDNGKIQDMMLYGKSSQDGTPTPENPVKIKSVVNPTVKVCGNNFYSGSDLIGLTKAYTTDFMPVILHKKKICISFDVFSDTSNGNYLISVEYFDANKENIGSNDKADLVGNNISHINFGFDESTAGNDNKALDFKNVLYVKVKFYIYANTATEITYKNIMVSATDSDFEPYKPIQTVTLPYTLNAIPVESGGNVTIDGQQYIADYVDVERGKVVRMCERETFNTKNGGINEEYRLALNMSSYAKENGGAECIFSAFEFESWGTCAVGSMLYLKNIKKPNNELYTAQELKELSLDFYAIYQLKETQEIDLTQEEITAFKALVTHYPTTNISVNSEQLDGLTVFNYPISLANGWNYVKQQLNDNRDYIYDMDLQSAEAYVNSEYAVALTELEV